MQDPEGRKNVIEWVRVELSKFLKVKSCKYHDIIIRNKLISKTEVFKWYELLRVEVVYQKGRKEIKKHMIVYPSDVIRYGRKTLAVMEDIARDYFVIGYSKKQIEDKYHMMEGFSFSSIKRLLKKIPVIFGRLLASRLVTDVFSVSDWLKVEKRDFVELVLLYWDYTADLSPPFSCLFS